MTRIANDPWKLVEGGRYLDAVAAYDELQRTEAKPRVSWMANRALALTADAQYGEARQGFLAADELARVEGSRMLLYAAQAAWLAGDRAGALSLSSQDVHLLQSGNTSYTDFFGGGSNGLFLYYIAVTLRDSEVRQRATRFLEKTLARMRGMNPWPGPLVRFVLGATDTIDQVLLSATGVASMNAAVAVAKTEIAACRKLVRALFYAGAKCRDDSNESECTALMKSCNALPNHYLELEWYIAREEAERPIYL